MVFKRLHLIFCILFSFEAFAEIPCNEYFHPKYEVYSIFDEVTYSNKINLWRKTNKTIRNFRGQKAEPAIVTMINKKILKLNDYILNRNETIPIREMEILFEEVELSAAYLKKSVPLYNHLKDLKNFVGTAEELVSILRTKGVHPNLLEGLESKISTLAEREKFVNSIEKSIKKKSRKLGSKIEEYILTKKHFEKLLKDEGCNSECRDFIQNTILNRVGVSSKSAQLKYPELLSDIKGFSLDEIMEILYVNHTSNVVRYRHELFYETMAVLKKTLENREKFEMIYRHLSTIPLLGKTKFFNFLLWAKNLSVLEKHFPQIDELVLSAKTLSSKLDDLKNLNKLKFSSTNDDFLVSFARKNDVTTKETWKNLKNEASKVDEEFHLKMENAEKVAAKEGPLSIDYKPKLSKKILIALGAGGLVYFSFSGFDGDQGGVFNKDESEVSPNKSNSEDLSKQGFHNIELSSEDEEEFEPLAHDTATVIEDPTVRRILNGN